MVVSETSAKLMMTRFLLLIAFLAFTGFLSGCAQQDHSSTESGSGQASAIPWNRPQAGEGSTSLGGFTGTR